jgi:membrane protein YdbS with pleckstrin-like domain
VLQALLCRYLRVPPEPAAPAGAPGSVRTFRAARGFLTYRLLQWGIAQAGAGAGLLFGVSFLAFVPDIRILGFLSLSPILSLLEAVAIALYVLQLLAGPFLVKLDYEMRWYIVTDRSLRIREGILKVREQTMTFSNIQNLSIEQGPVQRLFGIQDLKVRTAGGGETAEADHAKHAPHESMHVGVFRGVENASAIRDAVLAHLKAKRDTGLGESEPAAPRGASSSPQALRALAEAARELRDEAAALRRALVSEAGPLRAQ